MANQKLLNSPVTTANGYITPQWRKVLENAALPSWADQSESLTLQNLSLVIGTDIQAWASILDSLSTLSGDGLLAKSSSSVLARTLTPGSAKITIINGGGTTGNPTIDVDEAHINHDILTNYVANKHIDHSSVSISPGAGLSGGGTIVSTRTLAVDISSLTEDTAPDTNDYIMTHDTSASSLKKVLISNLLSNAGTEFIQDTVGTILTDSATVDFTYDDATTQITADIINGSVTYAKIQNVSATDKVLGRSTAGAGSIEEITCTSAGRALIDDADATAQRATLSVTGMLTAMRVYTASDTWTKPSNLNFIIVEVLGAGGGGAGCAAAGATGAVGSSGGASGGYGLKKIAAASLGSTETVTIGALGGGGAAGANVGTDGGTSSFGAHVSCTGGQGGVVGSTITSALTYKTSSAVASTVGVATGGDVNANGFPGERGYATGTEDTGIGGPGGCTRFGGGGGTARAVNSHINGNAGNGYGTGGGGGASSDTTDAAGGAGTGGLIIVYEYSI